MTQTLLACGVCGAETRDLYLCRYCLAQLAGLIADTPALIVDLNITLARQDAITLTEQGSKPGQNAAPLPINTHALDALTEIRSAIKGISSHPDHRRPDEQARLTARMPSVGARLTALKVAYNLALKVIDRPASKWFFGHCEACGMAMCGPPDALRVTCVCDRGYDATVLRTRQWEAVGESLVRRSEAVSLISARYHVDRPETVRKAIDLWIHRGALEDRAGWVRFGDVDALWRKRLRMRARKAELARAS
ncbi:hypothetical protein KIH74_23020 [Kineosporia sp. J2-2]|uniref:Amidophosphoribosyltransferase n=1 Tax=Kineosporia corallincola TaxID=2835133 RepID=A0ABS5TL60_9ACTN|nr:hypothetical protein [Kineosporia corallincola]MBT0771832.1 hypothetical protein [Kineosporia corallincola]